VRDQIVRFSKQLLAIKGEVEKNTLEIKEIREDLKQLTIVIQSLKHEIEMHQLKQEHELQMQRLELENILLRHFRPPSGNDAPPLLPPSE
jgi:hypothetical protein